jgi:hypothetical protein
MYLMLLNVTLKVAKVANCMLYILHNEKLKEAAINRFKMGCVTVWVMT